MLYDESHPHISLAFLMVLEALQQSAERILLIRNEFDFTVIFSSSNSDFERDQIPNRMWHSLLAAFHCLAGETTIYDPTSESNYSISPTAETEFNSILISDKFPQIKNTFLTQIREIVPLPLRLGLSFSDQKVTITINP